MRAYAIFLLAVTVSLAAWGGETLSPEALLPGHEGADAYKPVAAFGEGVYLVVWEAGRDKGADIVGVRVDKSGKVLDAKPFVISAAKDCQERPRIASDGKDFLVVWQDLRNGKDYDLYAARVTPAGKVLDADGIAISAEAHNQAQAAVCFDGKAFQVLWRDMRDGKDYDVYSGRVSADGRPLDGTGGLVMKRLSWIGMNASGIGMPAVGANARGDTIAAATSTRSGGIIAWNMRGGKADGKPVRVQSGARISNLGWEPTFASDGDGFIAAFTTLRGTNKGGKVPGSGLVAFDAAGKPRGKPVALSGKGAAPWSDFVRNPSVAWDGTAYVAAWDIILGEGNGTTSHWYDAVFLRRVSRGGRPQGANTPVAGEKGSPAYHPAVASDGAGRSLVAYERHPRTGDVPIRIAFRLLRAR